LQGWLQHHAIGANASYAKQAKYRKDNRSQDSHTWSM